MSIQVMEAIICKIQCIREWLFIPVVFNWKSMKNKKSPLWWAHADLLTDRPSVSQFPLIPAPIDES